MINVCACACTHVRACQCSQGLFSFDHCFTCVLNTLSSVNAFIAHVSFEWRDLVRTAAVDYEEVKSQLLAYIQAAAVRLGL